MARHRAAQKCDFCRYMAQTGAVFPLETRLGSKIPWDGSADPWDGKRNPWDGLPRAPHPRRLSNAKTRTEPRVRINGLPYSAQGMDGYHSQPRPQGKSAT